jgi:hypothetical protein
MSRDFFLQNRCYQIAKLCGSGSQAVFVLPATSPRVKLPPKLAEFYALLRRICATAHSTMPQTGAGLEIGATGQPDTSTRLSDTERRDLEEFERVIVACRFSADPAVKQPAVALMRALFADAEYFSGLKPLPQYTDAFAYELLFPSWLNLLKACMLPRVIDGKPRLSGDSQGRLFEFLGKVPSLNASDELLLTGYLTFIASRFDAPQAEELLQRVVELVSLEGASVVAALDSIDLNCKDARELRERLADFLVVKHSLLPPQTTSPIALSQRRPARRAIAPVLESRLKELETSQQWAEFFALASPLRCLIESPHALSVEYVLLLNQNPSEIGRLLSLLVARNTSGAVQVMSDEGQNCLAGLLRLQPQLLTSEWQLLSRFAENVAMRLEGLSESCLQYFQRMLIDDAASRSLLLDSCGVPLKRAALADQLLERAGKTDDQQRLLHLLGCVCVLSPRPDALEAKQTLQAIQAVVDNRSIGTKELGDLLTDLQSHHQQAMETLASPMMAAASKGPRLAALYLTLNEMSQKLGATGTVDNFSVVRAKYAKLTSMEFE